MTWGPTTTPPGRTTARKQGRQQGASHSRLHPAQQRLRAPQPKPGTVSFSRLSQVASGVRGFGWSFCFFTRGSKRRSPRPTTIQVRAGSRDRRRFVPRNSTPTSQRRLVSLRMRLPHSRPQPREMVHGVLPLRPRGPIDSRPQPPQPGPGTISFYRLSQVASGVRASGWNFCFFTRGSNAGRLGPAQPRSVRAPSRYAAWCRGTPPPETRHSRSVTPPRDNASPTPRLR